MKVLVVVDMQNDFISGCLGNEQARAIVGNVNERIKKYRDDKETIIFTRDTHDDSYFDTIEGKNIKPIHGVCGSFGHAIAVNTQDKDIILNKSSFGSFELIEAIRGIKKVEYVELVGVFTDICVVSNALLLRSAFTCLSIFVNEKCCAATTHHAQLSALRVMRSCLIDII